MAGDIWSPENGGAGTCAAEVRRMREDGRFTIPVSLGMEKRTNPFLRADDPVMARAMGLPEGTEPSVVFGALRRAKDEFK